MKSLKDTKLILSLVLLPLSTLGFILVVGLWLLLSLPDVDQMRRCMVTSMYQVRICPGEPGFVRYDQIAPSVIDAVVASEDAGFFQHSGFDWHEIRESIEANFLDRGYRRGGSTITQQLAKNVFLSGEKSIWRKIKEAAITIAIERRFSKREILERYLNVVEFGPRLYGVGPAARRYFEKAPGQLHLLEASYLAYLLPNPKVYSHSFTQKKLTPFAKKSLSVILRRLGGFKKISLESMQSALTKLDTFPWSQWGTNDFTIGTAQGESPKTSEAIQKIIDDLDRSGGAEPSANAVPESDPASDSSLGSPNGGESKPEEAPANENETWD